MPTVIDSLIVEIGLDPSKFTKGQKEAIKSFNDARENARKAGQEIEGMGRRSAEYLGLLQNGLLKVGAAAVGVAGSFGIGRLVTETIKQDAATSRLAYTLETGVSTLDKWRNAAYLAGGSAEGVTGFIQNLTSEFAKWEIHGESHLIPFFRGLGVQVSDANHKMRPFADIMRDVSNAVRKMGPAQGAEWLRSIGADQGSINLLIKGGDELERYLKLGEKFSAVTAQGAENASKMDLALRSLNLALGNATRAAMNWLGEKGLTSMAENLAASFQENADTGKWYTKGSLVDSMLNGTKFRGWGVKAGSTPEGGGAPAGAFKNQAEKEAFIRAAAAKRGIHPDIAMAVSRSEGFDNYESTVIRKDGTREPSYGAFQLYMGGGLGNVFQKKTGLDPRNPETEKQQIEFALDQAKAGGWGPWHGWKGSQWAGIERGTGSSTSNDVKIGTINIQTQATDAQGIAASIKPALENTSLGFQGQSGPQ